MDGLNAITVTGIAVLGFAAGTLGGMLGVGGSVLMIPGLTVLLGRQQHLYQAAAMVVNVFVASPAAWRHYKAGAVVGDVLRVMLPAAIGAVCVGVWLSNRSVFAGEVGEIWLGRVLAGFLVFVVGVNVRRLVTSAGRARDASEERPGEVSAWASGAVGVVMGLTAGLLGVGGGALAVPMQTVLLRLPLRCAIANSAAVMVLSAAVGAVYKNATLGGHGDAWTQSLLLAGVLAPTAFVGGRIGAMLTHRLPLRQVRIAFVVLLAVAAWKMAKLPWP